MGDELAMGGAQSGTDIDGQIRAGIEAFQQSQDPAIAVEVVNMLAEVYGIAPQIDPYADPGMQADPYAQQVPAAANGMRFYKKGGKFIVSKKKVQSVNSYANGGGINPKPINNKGVNGSFPTVFNQYSPSPIAAGFKGLNDGSFNERRTGLSYLRGYGDPMQTYHFRTGQSNLIRNSDYKGDVPKFAPGGMIDPKPSGRTLPKDVVTAYVRDSGNVGTPLTQIQDTDPVFYDSKQFNNFYKNKTVNAFTPEVRSQYDSFTTPGDRDAWIAAQGGLPNFEVYQRNLRAYEKTQIPSGNTLRNVARTSPALKSNTGGYQYGSRNQAGGTGRPAQGSITKPKFENGGSIDTPPEISIK